MSIPSPSEFLGTLFASDHQAGTGEATIGPSGQTVAEVTIGTAEPDIEISL